MHKKCTQTHTHITRNRFLPFFLLIASQLCSRYALTVITSGLNYTFSINHSSGRREMIWEFHASKQEKKKEGRDKKERSRKRVGGRNKSSPGVPFLKDIEVLLSRKKLLSQFHLSGGPINLCTPTHKCKHVYTHSHTRYLLTQTFANLHIIKEVIL